MSRVDQGVRQSTLTGECEQTQGHAKQPMPKTWCALVIDEGWDSEIQAKPNSQDLHNDCHADLSYQANTPETIASPIKLTTGMAARVPKVSTTISCLLS